MQGRRVGGPNAPASEEIVFFGNALLVTLVPLGPTESPRRQAVGLSVRRFDAATGELLGDLLVEGSHTLSKDRHFAAQLADGKLRRWTWPVDRSLANGPWRTQ